MTDLDSDLPRRKLLKTAVAIGGATGLSACLDAPGAGDPIPTGDPANKPDSQHAWREYIRTDDHGNSLLPRHQVLVYATLDGDGPPTEGARDTLGSVLGVLDSAYEWSAEGLLHSVAYSPSYFDRFEASLPDGIDLPEPSRLTSFEEPTFDTQDLLVHLASDRADAVLEAEQALTGQRDQANGVDVTATLTDVATVDSRRTGFVGAGLPAENQDAEGIPDGNHVPEESPLFMGFKAGFVGNQASEAAVTFDNGPFAGGTTKTMTNLRQRLEDWYGEQNRSERIQEMFSPGYDQAALVEGVGENLGSNSGIDQFVDDVESDAREFGRVGHAQKAARANRDAEGNVRLLRRHFESTDDIGSDQKVASLHFPTLQTDVTAFEEVWQAMAGEDIPEQTPAVRQRVNNGILEYIFTRRRGYFLVPPRRHRSLPTPRPGN